MNDRLARAIAQSTTKDGVLDRERLLDALSLSPNDPMTLVIECVLDMRQTADRQRVQAADRQKSLDATQATALAGVFNEYSKELGALLAKHVDQVEAAKEQLAMMTEDLAVTRAEARKQLLAENEILSQQGAELVRLARQIRDARLVNVRRIVIWSLCAFFAGAVLALIYSLTRMH